MGLHPTLYNTKKGALAAASDKVYQLLAHGWWFSPGTPASSTTKTGCHDIAEILLKVALSTNNQNQSYYAELWLKTLNLVTADKTVFQLEKKILSFG